jgi:hypothetical protein
MTREEWLSLKVGDVIVERKSKQRRRVIHVSRITRRGITRTGITLLKLVPRAWTPGPFTTYFNTDDRGRWQLLGGAA